MGKTIKEFYTAEKHMEAVYDKISRQMPVQTDCAAQLRQWQTKAKAQLRELLHLDGFESCPLLPQILESEPFDGYRRDKILLQTEPDVFMPVFMLVPNAIKKGEKRPVVIMPPGHGPGKFSTVNALDYDDLRDIYAQRPFDAKTCLALDLVKAGYIVAAPDTRGAGERREKAQQENENGGFSSNSHQPLNNVAICLGYSVTGMNLWDLTRLIDYIETRDDYDGRLCCGGHSGGGHLSVYLSAVDDRVQFTFTSGYFYGFKDSFLHLPQNCACNYVPNLWKYFDMGDFGAMIAPRPFFIESGDEDDLNGPSGLENVYPQVAVAKSAYACLKREDRLHHVIYHGNHGGGLKGNDVQEFLHNYMPVTGSKEIG